MYILPSKQEREILFEATRTCVWLKLDVCSMPGNSRAAKPTKSTGLFSNPLAACRGKSLAKSRIVHRKQAARTRYRKFSMLEIPEDKWKIIALS